MRVFRDEIFRDDAIWNELIKAMKMRINAFDKSFRKIRVRLC